MNKIAVSEYFYSLQGEGRTMGIPAIFIRLTGCNLMCGGQGVEKDGQLRDGATWRCDTIDVWMKGQTRPFEHWLIDWEAELNFLERLRQGAHLVITGGEPLLQQKRILALLEWLEAEHHCRPIVEVETNATLIPSAALDQRVQYWNTSPKLSNSGMPKEKRYLPEVLRWFGGNECTMAKFVINQAADFEEIRRDFLDSGLLQRQQLVLMPAAESIEELLACNQLVADICIREQVRMCTRMHVEIWNQLTGV